ncbi:hypothetical protein BOX15_Mlig029520g3 [Macrostomum lignano]|uniref:Uncharacterized protein n=1 Tax=Macrostomum lignano TaxID=282301 RepID=A0A267E770_9PLAT|nr:hypothetical protein BOX15_Mlig029520g3 [Macrostomum lignano]
MSDATPQAAAEASSKPQPPPRPKVKSYLHKFYCGGGGAGGSGGLDEGAAPPADAATVDASDEMRRLLASGGGKQRRGCHLRPIVWKAMLWIGINCLIFGALGLAIAFFLPHEPELVELPGVQGFVRSRTNQEWNRSANVLKYVALGVFSVGAVVTAVGLILPSLVWRLFDEDEQLNSATDPAQAGAEGGQAQRRLRRLLQRPPLAGLSGKTVSTRMAPSAAAAAPAEVEEKPVQPPRSPVEGHVTRGQIQVN